MKKMKCLFERVFEGHSVSGITENVTDGCEWVLQGHGTASEKIDGTACAVIDGKLYARFDAKKGRKLPVYAIPCDEPDAVTGHWPHWILVESQPNYKYHLEAYNRQYPLEDGTYELIGLHFQSNPYGLETDVLEKHGKREIQNPPRTFEDIKQWLYIHNTEGIVYKREDGLMCKIRRKDFGFNWPTLEQT